MPPRRRRALVLQEQPLPAPEQQLPQVPQERPPPALQQQTPLDPPQGLPQQVLPAPAGVLRRREERPLAFKGGCRRGSRRLD